MKFLRKWATPLTVASFLIMGMTGTLMFFHLDSGLNKLIHEWAGWVMLVGVLAHVVLNWRAFTTYFKRPLAMGIMGLGVVALAASFVPVGGSGGGDTVRMVMMSISSAQLETMIALSGKDTDAGLVALAEAGYDAQLGQSMATLTGGDRATQDAILAVLFAQ